MSSSPSTWFDRHRLGAPPPSPAAVGGCALFIVACGLAAYANSFPGAFVFDDLPSIVENPTLHSFFSAWVPPTGHGLTVEGRPLLNVTFAVNHAISGLRPWSYHATNLLIHLLAGLTLFGVFRRTFEQPSARPQLRADALLLATAATTLWLVHPLQTEAVTYVVQRAESLCGLLYLFGLYAFIRSLSSPSVHRRAWSLATLFALVAGAGVKEVIMTLPLMLLLYHRLFRGTGWRETLRERRGFYAALGVLWFILAARLVIDGGRADTAGFDTGVRPFAYFLTSADAIVHYLKLALWPHPLIFDYGRSLVTEWQTVGLQLLCLTAVAVGSIVGLARGRPSALLGLGFFLILAPSSSFVPISTQTIAEHRMYLPLAIAVVATVVATHRYLGPRSLLLVGAPIVLGIFGTARRNLIYYDGESLWRDTVAHAPANARAHLNYGAFMLVNGQRAAATEHFRVATKLDPSDGDAHNNLANALRVAGREEEAFPEFAAAVRLAPRSPIAHWNYAAALERRERLRDAEKHYALATALGAEPSVRLAWASVLEKLGRSNEAEQALREVPAGAERYAASRIALGGLLGRLGRLAASDIALREAVAAAPESADAHNGLGYVLLLERRFPEATAELAEAVRLAPGKASFHANYGLALARSGQTNRSLGEIHEALRLDPREPLATTLLVELGKSADHGVH